MALFITCYCLTRRHVFILHEKIPLLLFKCMQRFLMIMIDNISEVSSSVNSRLGNCEVCNVNGAKYTCPECEVKTCSLPCVKIHKKELNCSGIRNKVKFKPLKKINNLDFLSDYVLLEDATRATETFKKGGRSIQRSTFYSMPRIKIRGAAHKRNISLYYLPKHFSRHKSNTTYYDWKKDRIYWKIEWVFPDSGMVTLINDRVSETECIMDILKKYIDPEQCEGNLKKILACYHSDTDNIEVLLKLEKIKENKFCLVDKDDTFMENLSNKKIIENPVFYVVHKNTMPKYGLTTSEIIKKGKYSNNFKGVNLLFGQSIEDQDNPAEC